MNPKTPTVLLLAALAVGCSSDLSIGAKFEDRDTGRSPDALNDTDDAEPGDWDSGGGGLPSEQETDPLSLRPAQTDIHIFIVNPDRDTVTQVNVLTQDVLTKRVGSYPSVVRITRDYDRAVVFNQGDDTVSILDAVTLDETVVPVRDNLNAMVISPDGRWCVLWHDVGAERPDDPPSSGVVSYNEVSLIDVYGATHTPLVVGFNPKDIAFTPDGDIALAVADASLAVVRLDGDTPVPEYIGIADPLSPPVAEEVVVAPDGSYAFLRQRNTDALLVVDLDAGTVDSIPVGADPTDLDLTPDGTRAIVVSRGAREVSTFSVADPFQPPEIVPIPQGVPFGSVILDDLGAVLFTNASPIGVFATWDLGTTITLRPLPKPAANVVRTPTGGSLLVTHPRTDNDDGSTPAPYQGQPALSMVDLTDFRANTLRLADDVASFANSNNGRQGYVILEDQPLLAILDYTTLIYDEIPLRSNPVHLGVLPDLDFSDGLEPPAWVSQEHPLGRLSFYDPENETVETITGFELNAAIED